MAFNATAFLDALKEIEAQKGISRETVILALQDAITKAFLKELGATNDESFVVRVNLDPDNGVFEMYRIKKIVENVEDDFLQTSREEAIELAKENKGFIDGDEFIIPATVEQMRKATALSIKSMMKQKFAEAEKNVLFEAFKDKVNTLIVGRVEKVDDRGISVVVNRSSIYLPKNQLIGDEKFQVGEPIKLFVNDVNQATGKGAKIVVTRSNEGFLKCLFEEEIHEIFDGTIQIKAVAREAGERSKVAVYSNDPNVDPAGACIGPNGSRIQKIVGQLGNGQAREKIDIIAWSENPGLFIMESLKPAKVAGVIVSADKKAATAIVEDDSLSLAIGRRGVNVRLAVKLTSYNIDIKTKSDALEAGLEYQTFEELQAKEIELKTKKAMELAAAQHAASMAQQGLPEGYVAPQERVYEEENDDLNEALMEQVDREEQATRKAAVVETPVEEIEEEAPVAEEVAPAVEATPVEEAKEEPAPAPVEEKVEVKTTTSLDQLEKNLENDANKQNGKKFNKKFKKGGKKEEEEEEDTKGITDTSSGERMAIYTEEELADFDDEEEEEVYEEDDVDYDEYDDYYDEK